MEPLDFIAHTTFATVIAMVSIFSTWFMIKGSRHNQKWHEEQRIANLPLNTALLVNQRADFERHLIAHPRSKTDG